MLKLLFRLAALSGLALVINGCATLPTFEDDELSTAHVIKNIKCEFRDAAWQKDERNAWLEKWNAVFLLTLSVNHKGGLTADGTLSHPLTPGTLLLPLTLIGSGEATRTEKIEFKEKLSDLNASNKLDCPVADAPRNRHALLAGNIGIGDLLARARESRVIGDIAPSQLDYSLNFRIAKSANAAARFNLIPIGQNTLTAGLRWDGSREQNHTLNITLKENPAPCPFTKVLGVCPTLIIAAPKGQAKPYAVEKFDLDPSMKKKAGKKRSPGTDRKPALSRDAEDSLDRGLGRSILQDTLEEIRRRGITQ